MGQKLTDTFLKGVLWLSPWFFWLLLGVVSRVLCSTCNCNWQWCHSVLRHPRAHCCITAARWDVKPVLVSRSKMMLLCNRWLNVSWVHSLGCETACYMLRCLLFYPEYLFILIHCIRPVTLDFRSDGTVQMHHFISQFVVQPSPDAKCLLLHWEVLSQRMCIGGFMFPHHTFSQILDHNWLPTSCDVTKSCWYVKLRLKVSTEKCSPLSRCKWKQPPCVKFCTSVILHSEAEMEVMAWEAKHFDWRGLWLQHKMTSQTEGYLEKQSGFWSQ